MVFPRGDALRNAVVVLMNDIEMSKPENIQRIDLAAAPDPRRVR